MFTIKQLETFVSAARNGSFAAAADKLGVSQPAISDQICALERKLGYLLFDRRRGKPALMSPAGQDLLIRAEAHLRESNAIAMSDANRRPRRQVVRIYLGHHLRDTLLRPLLPQLIIEHPEIEVQSMPEMEIKRALELISSGGIDLLVHSMPNVPTGFAHLRELYDVPLILACAPSLATQLNEGTLKLEDVPFVNPSEAISRWLLDYMHSEHGIQFRGQLFHTMFPDVALRLVEDGFGMGALMLDHISDSLQQGRLARIGPPLPLFKRIVIRAPSSSPSTKIVEDFLASVLMDRSSVCIQ